MDKEQQQEKLEMPSPEEFEQLKEAAIARISTASRDALVSVAVNAMLDSLLRVKNQIPHRNENELLIAAITLVAQKVDELEPLCQQLRAMYETEGMSSN